MQERLRQLLDRFLEWWNRFTTKQKTLIISVGAAVVVALTVLIWTVSAPKYTVLAVADSTAQTAQIRDLLDENAMDYKISDDGLTININKKQLKLKLLAQPFILKHLVYPGGVQIMLKFVLIVGAEVLLVLRGLVSK